MNAAVQPLTVLLPVLHLVTALLYGMSFGGPDAPRVGGLRRIVGATLLLAHGLLAAAHYTRTGQLPLNGPAQAALATAFTIALLFFAAQAITRTPPSPGGPVFLLTFLFTLGGAAFGDLLPAANPRAESPFFVFHVVSAVTALGALLLSGLYGALYLVQLREIRRQHFGSVFRNMPDLTALGRLNRTAAGLGCLLLTVGINVGIWWAHEGAVQSLDYTSFEVLPLLVLWLVFGLIAAARSLPWLTARRAATVAVTAALLLLIATILMFLPMASIHDLQ